MPVWGAHAVRRVLSTDPSSPIASPSAPHQTPSSHPQLSFMPLRPCPRCALPPRMLSFPLTRQTPLILYKDPAPMSTPCSALKGCPASFGRPGCASRGFAPSPCPGVTWRRGCLVIAQTLGSAWRRNEREVSERRKRGRNAAAGHLGRPPRPAWRVETDWPPAHSETPALGWKGKWIETS